MGIFIYTPWEGNIYATNTTTPHSAHYTAAPRLQRAYLPTTGPHAHTHPSPHHHLKNPLIAPNNGAGSNARGADPNKHRTQIWQNYDPKKLEAIN